MKRFLMLHYGFEKPSPEIMAKWQEWFELTRSATIAQGHFPMGREISRDGVRNLPLAADSITGYSVIEAENLDEAETLAAKNPFIDSIRVYEIAG